MNNNVVVKVYHSYGDDDSILIIGHVLKRSPEPSSKNKNSIYRNLKTLLKLFLAKPCPNAQVSIIVKGQLVESITDEDGFFRISYNGQHDFKQGWNHIEVHTKTQDGINAKGDGKLLIPSDREHVFISDIDDTFLVSHSANTVKKLYELFTKKFTNTNDNESNKLSHCA